MPARGTPRADSRRVPKSSSIRPRQAPAILALILGPMMERSLRTTLEISAGSFAIFLDRPLALALLTVPVIVLGFMLLRPRALAQIRQADAE